MYEVLERITTDNLSKYLRIAGIKGSPSVKLKKIELLIEEFNKPGFVKKTYESLSPYEKEIVDTIVQYKYHPETKKLFEIREKYNIKVSYFSQNKLFDAKSKVNLLFLNYNNILPLFREELNKLVPTIEYKIKGISEEITLEDHYDNIIDMDKNVSKYDELIKILGTNKIKLTKAKGNLPKSVVLKIYNKINNQEVLKNNKEEIAEIRDIEDTIVIYGITKLLENADIYKIKKEELVINNDICSFYARLNKYEKIKYLFNNYLEDNKNIINECDLIDSHHFHIQVKKPSLSFPRKIIIEYLKKCPIGVWIDIEELLKAIRIDHYCFLRNFTGEVLIKDEYYNQYYNSADHEEFENSFINVVLLNFLAPLGIVDVVIDKKWDDYDYYSFLEVSYFRITKLGAYVLGLEENIEIENNNKPLEVTKNFEIITKDTKKELEYDLYLERFLEKKEDKYLITFSGMCKALELELSIKEIYKYLLEETEDNIPQNVKEKFKEWITNERKIKVKTITIIETDEENLHEILKNNKIKPYIKEVRNEILEIDDKDIKNIQKELEKQEKFIIFNK